jgi:CheY-like chemotaxis protein
MVTNDLSSSSDFKAENNSEVKILLVEDDYVSQTLTTIALRKVCNLDIADNGNEAHEMAKVQKYKLILMDINLGKGLTGLDTAGLIKNLPGYENTPIVALTAYAMTGDKEEFLQKGCTHYLSKPFDINELIYLVKSLI